MSSQERAGSSESFNFPIPRASRTVAPLQNELTQPTPASGAESNVEVTSVEQTQENSPAMDKKKRKQKRPRDESAAAPVKRTKLSSTSKTSSATRVVEPGTSSTPPTLEEIHSYYSFINLNDPTIRKKLELLHISRIIPHYRLDWSFLNQMGLSKRIRECIAAIEWEKWLIEDVNYPVYRELCLEFYSTLNIHEGGSQMCNHEFPQFH